MYIYHLPRLQITQLSRILDQNDNWAQLGQKMQYERAILDQIKSSNSPTEKLLLLWGQLNHTVLELFVLLKDIKCNEALICLKPFVDKKYHRLIQEIQEEKIINRDIDQMNNMIPEGIEKLNIKSKCKNMDKEIMNITRDDNVESFGMKMEKEPATPRIDYDELRIATSNWNQKAILGKGGFGTVYKGVWKHTKVAVKRIETRKLGDTLEALKIQMEQSMRELHCLNTYRHDNILSLYGYSIGGQHPCLVYQYMSGGNLEQRLRKAELHWQQRIHIARGTARGLQFLHTIGTKPLIHGDIKSANILLDKSMEPKIGDFGLAREGPISDFSHVEVSRVHGTRPYLPDEFLRGKKMSTKVDTFSFGVVLFEIGTGLSAYHESYKFLKDFVADYQGDILGLKDKKCPNGDDIFCLLMSVGMECISKRARDRPEMVDVLQKLGDSMLVTF